MNHSCEEELKSIQYDLDALPEMLHTARTPADLCQIENRLVNLSAKVTRLTINVKNYLR